MTLLLEGFFSLLLFHEVDIDEAASVHGCLSEQGVQGQASPPPRLLTMEEGTGQGTSALHGTGRELGHLSSSEPVGVVEAVFVLDLQG